MATPWTDSKLLEELTVLPKRRLNFSIPMKQQAIAWIRGPGRGSPRHAVQHFRNLNWEVTAEILEKWWKNRDKIMGAPHETTILEPKWAVMLSFEQEQALANVIRRRVRKVRVSAKWIVQAVRQMYPDSAHRRFSASKPWLRGFTQRHGLELVGVMVVVTVDASLDQTQLLRRRTTTITPSPALITQQKTHSGRSMSILDVIHEDKAAFPTITA